MKFGSPKENGKEDWFFDGEKGYLRPVYMKGKVFKFSNDYVRGSN